MCACVCQTAVPEFLYCKIGVFMAAAPDNTDHLLKRSMRREDGGRGTTSDTCGGFKASVCVRGGGEQRKHEMKTQWDAAKKGRVCVCV